MALDTKKAVDDAIRNVDSDDRRTITFGGGITPEAITADTAATLGRGWSLTALYKRWFGSNTREGRIRVTKDF